MLICRTLRKFIVYSRVFPVFIFIFLLFFAKLDNLKGFELLKKTKISTSHLYKYIHHIFTIMLRIHFFLKFQIEI